LPDEGNLKRLKMNQGNYINIGSTPCEEDCLSVGHPLAQAECQLYRNQLKRMYPEGKFVVKGFPHDFGHYYEVVALREDEAQTKAAWAAESDDGGVWDAQAKAARKVLFAAGSVR